MPRKYEDLFPEDAAPQPPLWAKEEDDGPEAPPSLPPRLLETEDPLAGQADDNWEPEGGWPSWVGRPRHDDPSLDRPQSVRMADVLDDLVPEAYRGKTWTIQYNGGPVECRFPPMRDDPQGPVIQAFIDFQDHAHALKKLRHPEYYCVECRSVYVTSICPHCKSARVRPTGGPRVDNGTPYRCDECGQGSMQALVCGRCRRDMTERYGGQLALPERVVQERKSSGRRKRPKELEDRQIPGMD